MPHTYICGPGHFHPERQAFDVARAALRLACMTRANIGRKRTMNLVRAARIQERAAIRAEDYCYGG